MKKKSAKTQKLWRFSWLGWRDSNPRMAEPEPAALPLGDIPSVIIILAQKNFFVKNRFFETFDFS